MTFENNTSSPGNNKAIIIHSGGDLSREAKRKIIDFEQGDITSLESADIIEIIPQHIFSLYNKGDMRFALILLENLGDWSCSENIRYRERSLMALSLITEKVLEEDNEDFLEALSRILIKWLRFETEYLAGFEFICLQLQKMVHRMLDLGLWYQAEDLIITLYKIKRGVIRKSKVFTQVIAGVHSRLAEKPFLETLTHTYLNEHDDRQDIAATLLINFGNKSAFHLLYTLCNCKDKNQRLNLIEILPATGPETIPALINLLQRKPPWYIIRNIILILSKLADPSLFYLVQPFMTHRDIRVQQEVIDCARRMNGNKMVDRLLDALNVCNDKLKPQVVRHLGAIEDKRIGAAISGLLKKLPSCDELIKDEIVREICFNFQSFPSQEAVDALQNFIVKNSKRKDISNETLLFAEKTFISLQKSIELLEGHEQKSIGTIESQGNNNESSLRDFASYKAKTTSLKQSENAGHQQDTLTIDIDLEDEEEYSPAFQDIPTGPKETKLNQPEHNADGDTFTIESQEDQKYSPALTDIPRESKKTSLNSAEPEVALPKQSIDQKIDQQEPSEDLELTINFDDMEQSDDDQNDSDDTSYDPNETSLDLFPPTDFPPEQLTAKEPKESKEKRKETSNPPKDWLTQSIENGHIPSFLKKHLQLRIDFYQQFSEDEFTAFLSYLSPRSYKQGEPLVSMGDVHSNLFFIDSGNVKLVFPEGDSETFVKELQEGDVFGNDIFMSGSEWDVSLVASCDVEVYVFDQEQLIKMQSRFPDLSLKILEYCNKHDVILGLLRMTEERPSQPPSNEQEEQPTLTGNTGEFIADIELVDISAVGFCFSLSLPRGFNHSIFADKKLSAFFSKDSDSQETVDGDIIGLQLVESDNNNLYIFAKFQKKTDLGGYTCTRVGLL